MMTNHKDWTKPLDDIFREIVKDRDPEHRLNSARKLKQYVASQLQMLKGEHFVNLMQDTNKYIKDLTKSTNIHDVQGAILAIDKLLDIEYDMYDGDVPFVHEWSVCLRNALHQSDNLKVVKSVTACLARFARIYHGSIAREVIGFEIGKALEGLGQTNLLKRQTALLFLAEMILQVPTLISHTYVENFFDVMWTPLCDSNPDIRQETVDVLRASLKYIRDRSELSSRIQDKSYNHARDTINNNKSTDALHGSILVLIELFSNNDGAMSNRFDESFHLIFSLKDHKSPLIRRTVIQAISKLVSFNPDVFLQKYLFPVTNFLTNTIKKEKGVAMITIGEIVVVLKGQTLQEEIIDLIFEAVMTVFKNKPKPRMVLPQEVYTCLSLLVEGLGYRLVSQFQQILSYLFSTEFCQGLVGTLSKIAQYVPDMKVSIQKRLLEVIKIHLAQPEIVTYTCHLPRERDTFVPPPPFFSFRNVPTDEVDREAMALLSLQTLSSFEFDPISTRSLLPELVVPYLSYEKGNMRKQAVIACSKLLHDKPKPSMLRGYSAEIVTLTLERLLYVALTDPDDTIRLTVLQSLNEQFDHYLSQPDFLKIVFLFINDEVFDIQILSISLLGRLSKINPAYVHPILRSSLISLIHTLDYADDIHQKEKSVRLYALIVRSLPSLVRPYTETILTSLLAKLKNEVNSEEAVLQSYCLQAIGDMASVSGDCMLKRVDELLQLIIDSFQDQNSSLKRMISLYTLGELIESTGYVIEPLIRYPKLLDTILHKIKRAATPTSLCQHIKLLGIIGAIDPYRHKMLQLELLESDKSNNTKDVNSRIENSTFFKEFMRGLSPQSEDYYSTVTLDLLLRFLRNPYGNLANLQMIVIQAAMTIFKSMGLRCVPYLKHFMHPLMEVMEVCGTGNTLREMMLIQLRILVSIIQHYTRDYLPLLMQLMEQYWNHPNLLDKIILLLREISIVLGDEFKPCLHKFLPKMLHVLQSKEKQSIIVLESLREFGTLLDEYLPLVIPAVVKLFDVENTQTTLDIPICAIRTIGLLSYVHDLTPYSISIFHHLVLVLDSNSPNAQKAYDQALKTVCDIASTSGSLANLFIGTIGPIVAKRQLVNSSFSELVSKLRKKEPIIPVMPKEYDEIRLHNTEDSITNSIPPKAGKTNSKALSNGWNSSTCVTKEDWTEWFRRISFTLLDEAPSPALRCCTWLAKNHNPVARELFNPGFMSCWDMLSRDLQLEVVKNIENALSSTTIPSEILHILLDLAEFMERSEKALPLDIKILGHLSEKCQAYAKALYYREKEFKETKPITEKIIENLITINDQLGQHDSAKGLLDYAKEQNICIDISWHEKLQQWIKVLSEYEEQQKKDPQNIKIILGRMRCLTHLGSWEELEDVAEEAYKLPNHKAVSSELSSFVIRAAFNLGHWEVLEKNIMSLDRHSIDGSFYHAVIAVHHNQFDSSLEYISRCRELVAYELTALMGESYSRAYNMMVRIQQLAEIEEIITYKQTNDMERRQTIRKLWENRLEGVERNVDVWQNILAVRSLVLPPREDPKTWVKFGNLVRKNRRFRRSMRIFTYLLAGERGIVDPQMIPADANPLVKYSYLNLLWDKGDFDKNESNPRPALQTIAYKVMSDWVKTFHNSTIDKKQQARCYVKLAQWQLHRTDNGVDDLEKSIETMIDTVQSALNNEGQWYKAWLTWAIINYRVLRYYYGKQYGSDDDDPRIKPYLLPAVNGFIQAIKLAPRESLQDILRLLSLWFDFGHRREVEAAIREGIDSINIDTWLSVIPQLIARIHSPAIKNGIQHLLNILGISHPQALVFSITVALKSPFRARVVAAQQVLNAMRQHSLKLVNETLLISDELIRTAILWKEKWFKGLEEASQLYYIERRVDKMMAVLQPLHEMLNLGPVTKHEMDFSKVFGKDLKKAWDCCLDYTKTHKDSSMLLAWDLYTHVYRIIKKHLTSDFDKLNLSMISPQLQNAKDLSLAIPGTYMKAYKAKKNPVTIKSINTLFKVIPSKQKPRKLIMYGSDGNEYPFLLKGHEDLRQDERVMQLFGLLNNLLEKDDLTSKHHLVIQGYNVIPLSSDSGLIEWLPTSDTIHELITFYRKTHKIPLEFELSYLQRICTKQEYYQLPTIQKLEIFELALEQNTGNDLERILWLNSKNSELWLDKRSAYTRSLATMSMVGYILGLGDRHPNNLMLNRNSGQIIHIDFGDCFEIAQQREKFAERVPFRLTRMLENAMEVSGIRGTFSTTCEEIMRVLQANKESIKAVLEAFVYDPLLSWRLTIQTAGPKDTNDGNTHSLLDKENLLALKSDSFNPLNVSPPPFNNTSSISIVDLEATELAKYQGYEKNEKAIHVLQRIEDKLAGRDFPNKGILDVKKQVELLIQQATSREILCQAYLGWCPYW